MTTQKKISIAQPTTTYQLAIGDALIRQTGSRALDTSRDNSGAYLMTDGNILLITDRENVEDWELENPEDPANPWHGCPYAYLYPEGESEPIDLGDVVYRNGETLQTLIDRWNVGTVAMALKGTTIPEDIWGDEYNADLIAQMWREVHLTYTGYYQPVYPAGWFDDAEDDDEEED